MLQTIQEIIDTEKHAVFAPACYEHGLVESSIFYDIKINGASAWDQLGKFLDSFGEFRLHLISNCEQVNCQETCREIEIGPNTYCYAETENE